MKNLLKFISVSVCFLSAPLARSDDVTILSMWQTMGELRAVSHLADMAQEAGLSIRNVVAEGNFDGTRSEFIRQLSGENHPVASQWIMDAEMHQLIESGITMPVDISPMNAQDILLPEVSEILMIDDVTLTGLPLAIHTQNHVIMNADAFSAAGLSYPATFDELLAALPELKAAGVTPIAMSDQVWQVRILATSLLSALITKDDFDELLTSPISREKWQPIFSRMFETIRIIRSFANDDIEDLPWNVATKRVLDGEAAIQILGDYVGSESDTQEGFVCSVFPGANAFLWSADSLVFLDDGVADHQGLSDILTEHLLKASKSEGYIRAKSGLPVLKSFEHNRLSKCSQSNWNAWRDYAGNHIFLDGKAWLTTLEAIGRVATDFLKSQHDMTPDYAAKRLCDVLQMD